MSQSSRCIRYPYVRVPFTYFRLKPIGFRLYKMDTVLISFPLYCHRRWVYGCCQGKRKARQLWDNMFFTGLSWPIVWGGSVSWRLSNRRWTSHSADANTVSRDLIRSNRGIFGPCATIWLVNLKAWVSCPPYQTVSPIIGERLELFYCQLLQLIIGL